MKKIFLIAILVIIFSFSLLSASNVGLIEDSTWQSNLTAVRFSATAFGDLDNDGDLDLILTGCLNAGATKCDSGVIAKVYINNGTTLTEDPTWQQNLTAVGHSSLGLGDIDNDGDLDLVLTGCNNATDIVSCSGDRYSKIYINNGTSLVENSQWQQNLTAVAIGSIAFSVIDNDGNLDLALTGKTPTQFIAKIYINNGTSLVENPTWQSNLTGGRSGSLIFGDIDNDGDKDLYFAGYDGTSWFSNIYLNNGTSFVDDSIWDQSFSNWGWPENIFGDYDNDGDLDLIRTGTLTGDHLWTYKNNGSTFVVSQKNSGDGGDLGGGLYDASLAFGDYDNDGNLDFVAMGRESGRNEIYKNNESKNYNFSIDSTAGNDFANNDVHDGSLVWIDLDNDGDLDLIISGANTSTGLLSKIYINNNTVLNTKPSAPSSSFSSSSSSTQLNLSWGSGSDSETNTSGLYYNLMVGNSTTNHTIISGVYGGSSNPTAGYFGNMMQRKAINLSVSLSDGTYYWYVQTIDTGLAKSSWSSRQTFTVGADTTKPTLTSISSSVGSTTATITWTTDESSNSTVYYGTTVATSSTQTSASSATSHSIALSGLSASTLYYYNVSSCDSSNNCNTSTQNSFTTSAASSNGGNGGGGGGSGGGGTTSFWTSTEVVSDDEFEKGYTQEVSEKQRLKISVSGETHYVGIVELTDTTATINITSDPVQVILSIGNDVKLDVLHDGFYDIYVLLNNIVNQKANLTIKSIHEEIPEGEEDVMVSGEDEEEIGEEEGEKNLLWLWIVISVIVVIIIIFLSRYFLERHSNRFNHKIKIVEKKMGNKIILIKRKSWKKRLKNKMKRGVIRWLR